MGIYYENLTSEECVKLMMELMSKREDIKYISPCIVKTFAYDGDNDYIPPDILAVSRWQTSSDEAKFSEISEVLVFPWGEMYLTVEGLRFVQHQLAIQGRCSSTY